MVERNGGINEMGCKISMFYLLLFTCFKLVASDSYSIRLCLTEKRINQEPGFDNFLKNISKTIFQVQHYKRGKYVTVNPLQLEFRVVCWRDAKLKRWEEGGKSQRLKSLLKILTINWQNNNISFNDGHGRDITLSGINSLSDSAILFFI